MRWFVRDDPNLLHIQIAVDQERYYGWQHPSGQNVFGDAELGMGQRHFVNTEHCHKHGRVSHRDFLKDGQNIVKNHPFFQKVEQLAQADQRIHSNLLFFHD